MNFTLCFLIHLKLYLLEIKDITMGKEEVKWSLFVDITILYIENPKDYTTNLLELINSVKDTKAT